MRCAGERRETSRQAAGLTLVEMLVVIGMVAAVVTLALPAISRARESARRVACLANIRDLTHAALLYLADNDNILPDACATNSVESQLCPLTTGKSPGQTFFGYPVLPTIGQLLSPYLNGGLPVWQCPDAPTSKFFSAGDNPMTGTSAPNFWLPCYHYMCDKELLRQALVNSSLTQQTQLRAWAARNVSGLRVNRVSPLGANSRVVLFFDHDSTFHSDGNQQIYTYPGNWSYFANFGYLDGHAEGHAYRNVEEYLGTIHGPIRQSWNGVDFVAAFPEQYAGY